MLTMVLVKGLMPDPKRGDYVVWDRPGFGVRVRASGVKSYILKYRNKLGEQRKMTLGSVDRVPLAQARKEAQRLLAEAALGKDPAAARIETRGALKLSDLADRWIADLEAQGRKAKGIDAYRWYLDKYLIPRFGKRIARTLAPAEVRKAYFEIKDSGKLTLANRVFGTLSSMLGWAQRRDLIPMNPCAGAIARQDRAKEKPSTRYLSEAEVSRFLGATRTLKAEGGHAGRMAAGFELMLLCGLRPSDVYGLKWSEIDFDAGLIRFENQKSGDAPAYLRGPAAALLKSLDKTDDMYVFPSPRGTSGRPVESGRKVWDRVVELASFDDPQPSPKSLRKTFATLARSWGHPMEAIGPMLRHAPQGVTAKHYAHAHAAIIGEAAESIQVKLAGLANPKAKVVKIKTK